MPPINHAAISAGVIVASVAVAAAIAIYESPELQRMANDLRRRIALAVHSIGDGIQPPTNENGEPLFNRPEDAEGFLQSSDVDADDETRRRQREELMYWNAMKLSRELEKQTSEAETQKILSRASTDFDDFLLEDKAADEKGTYVYNTGADLQNQSEGLVRRRGASESSRALRAFDYANPFADEHGIDFEEDADEHVAIGPSRDETMSPDIYNATPEPTHASIATRTMTPEPVPSAELAAEDYMTAGQDTEEGSERQEIEHDAYASVQAWAQQQSGHESAFYSPLPVTPVAATPIAPPSEMSDGELVSDGQLTPTDSASVAGSGIDVGHESTSQNGSSKYYDVLSEDEDGVPTPAHSWTEVGSVVSESEDGFYHAARA